MSAPSESIRVRADTDPTRAAQEISDRRADVDAKQLLIAGLLKELGCEGILILEPENLGWLTSGASARGVLNPADYPALYLNAEQRWVIASNVDSQRLFDEELDGLGFQLKEWPWYWGRQQLLSDLTFGRIFACDRPHEGARHDAGDRLRGMRCATTPYEQACYRALGNLLSHAVEATCRTMAVQDTEREIAGQVSHRLLHRGVQPVVVEVAADGRSRLYRQCGFTSLPIRRYCVLTVTARKFGLFATTSRSICFGPIDETFQREFDAASKVAATYLASSWPDALPAEILNTGRRVYQLSGFEHEWRLAPQGHITGRAAVELPLTPAMTEVFQPGWVVTWHAGVGAAFSCDTFLISDEGPQLLTPVEAWPIKKIRIQGADFYRPDMLVR